MKRVLLVLTVLICAVMVMAEGVNESNELTVYTPASKEQVNIVVPLFEQKYGVIVNVVEGGTGELFNRIKAEAENVQADVMFTGGIDSGGSFRDYLDDYVSVEEGKLFDKAVNHPWYNAVYLHPMGIIYNTNLVNEGEVKGWMDLTDPKWEGKVLMPDPRKSGSAFGELIIHLQTFGRDDKGWDYFESLYKNLVVTTSSSHTYKFVASGEYPLGLTHERNAYKYRDAGEPVGFVYPEEGTAVRPDGIYLIKNGPNPELAKKFIDFLLSKEVMELLRDTGYRVNRIDVEAPPGYPVIDVIKTIDYDPVWAAENRAMILEKYTEIAESN
ncbi:MAG: iron ABC transporter substrate-binding protein [Spirochaetes bacterium]|nr:MAG: iron ABC transporter substrate-binding protein [Spirochaetota bacterium]RKX97969.1 MAG: iron ABC transporter substrate-binding protein [Spirochaetota bacterium]